MKKRFLVVGLGVLGNSVATTLAKEGAEVIVVDQSPELIEEIRERVDVAVVGDATDRKMLEQLGAAHVDAALVCIGENFEAAILATVHLLEMKVRHVAARANSELAKSILKKLGAHEVFYVEHAMGKVIAHKLFHAGVMHEMDLGEGYRVIQLLAPKGMVGHSLHELALPKRFGVQIVALRCPSAAAQNGGMKPPTAQTTVQEGDILLISGNEPDLERFLQHWKAD